MTGYLLCLLGPMQSPEKTKTIKIEEIWVMTVLKFCYMLMRNKGRRKIVQVLAESFSLTQLIKFAEEDFFLASNIGKLSQGLAIPQITGKCHRIFLPVGDLNVKEQEST